MRYVAMLLMLALCATTTFAQSQDYTQDASQVPQVVANQPLGRKLYIKLKTGKFLDGVLTRINADTFEITFKKKVEKIAYTDVAAIVASSAAPDPPTQKKSFWKRVGYGFQVGFAIAAFGTITLASLPTTTLSDRATKTKANSLRKKIAKSLPPGTSRSQVLAFLSANKIQYSEPQLSPSSQPFALAGQPGKTNQIQVSIPGHNWFSFYTNSIHLTFFFDDKDRLIDSTVETTSYCDCL